MTTSELSPPAGEERELVVQLAAHVIGVAAPEESVLFEVTTRQYLADPEGVLHPRGGDEALGFGLDLALLTPYALAVITTVVQQVLSSVGRAAQDEVQATAAGQIRRLLHRLNHQDPEPAPPGLSADQLRQIHQVALERAVTVGLDEERAVLLSDAITGCLAGGG